MNKFTIILLTSFLAYIQIANALPMFEVPAHREQKKDNAAELADPCDSNNSPDVVPNAPDGPVDDKGKEEKEKEEAKAAEGDPSSSSSTAEEDDTAQECEQEKKGRIKNYRNMEDFVLDAIRDHMGNHFDLDSMSEETEQELYDMFCEMDIISV